GAVAGAVVQFDLGLEDGFLVFIQELHIGDAGEGLGGSGAGKGPGGIGAGVDVVSFKPDDLAGEIHRLIYMYEESLLAGWIATESRGETISDGVLGRDGVNVRALRRRGAEAGKRKSGGK